MASLAGLKNKLIEYKPKVQSAFVVYVTQRESPIVDPDESFTMVEVNTPDDPLLKRICATKLQYKFAQKAMADGRWDCIVALDPHGEPVGRIWETFGTERAPANGLPRVRLANDEFFMFDLFVEKEHRRGGVAFAMADYFFKKYPPETTDTKIGYGFISYENSPSILWHHAIGFQIAQTMNYLSVGPYIKWKMPFSDMPRFGPMSKKGRHSDPTKDIFGPPLFP